MESEQTYHTSKTTTAFQPYVLAAAFFLFLTILLYFFSPESTDWINFFYPAAKNVFDPYSVYGFINFPWLTVVISPLGMLPLNLSLILNASLGMFVIAALIQSRKGGILSLILTMTSFPFLASIANGTIEWVPALGFLLTNEWGFLMLMVKPQSGVLAGLDWFL